MRCNILRRPAFPGGNLKEKQFHIKLSDTMQVCGEEERVGEEKGRQIARSACAYVWMVGGVALARVFRSFLTAIGQLERDTHIPSAELKGMEWMKFQSLPCRHTLCFAHISTEMFKYSTLPFQPGFISCTLVSDMVLLWLMRKPNPKKIALHAYVCAQERSDQMSPFFLPWC